MSLGILLCQYALRGDLKKIKSFVEKGVDLSFYGEMALSNAASECHIAVVKYLITHGVNFNALIWVGKDGFYKWSIRENRCTTKNTLEYILV